MHDTPENRSIRVHFFEYARFTQPQSHQHVSPYEKVFDTPPRLPLNFQLSNSRKQFGESTANYGSGLSPHSHNQSTDINPLFHSILLKPFSKWFLGIKKAMLQDFAEV